MNTEQDIIYDVLQKFWDITGLTARWFAAVQQQDIDGKIKIKIEQDDVALPLTVKKELKNIHLINIQRLRDRFPELLVISEIIHPNIRRQMKQMGIQYMDVAGNAYLKMPRSMIYLEGFKTTELIKSQKTSKLFTKSGLILIFHFLLDEAFLNETYRHIAAEYDIALGNVNNVIKTLKLKGYLKVGPDKKLKLIDKDQLIQEWVTSYADRLKPNLQLGNFRFLISQEISNWKKLPIKNNETQWGGEPAGELITNYLKPARLTLYTVETKTELIKKYKLVPENKGNIEIYRKFWKYIDLNKNYVPPLLVYADLVNTNDPRNLETARKIYDEHIKNQF